MATFFRNGDPGCDSSNWEGPAGSSNPASFAPTNLNVSNWVDSMRAIGVKNAVLTAKHGCGFLLWPTNVLLPSGAPYFYNVNSTLNVVQQFAETMSAAGIAHGFYYSLTNNFYLNVYGHQVQPGPLLPGQQNVTQAQFESIALQQLTELWTLTGSLGEIWLDGGYTSDMQANLTALIARLQPNATAFNGAGVTANPLRWCGTEGGDPPGWPTVWGAECANPPPDASGCPSNAPDAAWVPSACDFTLQANDVWFYEPGNPLRALSELMDAYNKMVGGNSALELDFAIDRTGNVHPSHAALYASFGAWIDACYGAPVATQTFTLPGTNGSVVLAFPGVAAIDRIMLAEDVTASQLVNGYTAEVLVGPAYALFSSGVTVGAKRIDVITSGPLNATAVRVNVTNALAAGVALTVSAFAAAACAQPSTRVSYHYGATGMCLASNASTSFPCPGGAGVSCPLFLAPCDAPGAVWDDGLGFVAPLPAYGPAANIDLDCTECVAHRVLKLLGAAGPDTPIAYANGQLVLTCSDGATVMCLNGGQGPITPPCNSDEFYVQDQIQIDDCSAPSTQGWTRVVVG